MNLKIEEYDNGQLLINSDFSELLAQNNIFTAEDLWNFKGTPVKKQRKERGTEQAFLQKANDSSKYEVYIKRYEPLPIKEYFKSITSFRPINRVGALHEWNALLLFHKLNLSTMDPIAIGKLPGNYSCNMTLGIQDYTRASELIKKLSIKGSINHIRRRHLIKNIADFASKMHNNGFAHQDFYLVHIFVKEKENDKIYLIDLQRVIMQNRLLKRWRIKDLAQLYYSARPYVTNTDIFYFWKIYSNNETKKNKPLIRSILKKAKRIKRHAEK